MPGHGRRNRRLPPSFAAAATGYAATAMLGSPAWAMPTDTADAPTPCWSDQIAVAASPTQAAVGHRAATLVFSLAGGAEPCTLTGYPGVDSGAGGPLIHAQPTLRGYMGGLPDGAEVPPTVILSLSTQAQAIVEGIAIDANGEPCPTYTELLVNPPDTTVVLTVPAAIDACALQVHPVTPV
ncbi:DUF4232 domain-containing protein [Mycobacterium sp. 852014-50255_SCH5639931]|uniref:DUF4232 domain-containing protein n=1 Tax=Mycobacterium sp. 852014-50255_SCH5639931 TaxID=1834112 RepID=UPI0018D4CE8C|nr:DUF4232 domain-containing protein [Mycobacterium sp. 852014-50255_SCH5639931]